jgi:hypothetical protein
MVDAVVAGTAQSCLPTQPKEVQLISRDSQSAMPCPAAASRQTPVEVEQGEQLLWIDSIYLEKDGGGLLPCASLWFAV